MRIVGIEVKGLFGTYDHRIEFSDEGLTFIHSMNGVGKSVTLKLLTDLFNGDAESIRSVPFDSMTVRMADGGTVLLGGDGSVRLEKDGVSKDLSIDEMPSICRITYLSTDRNMHYIGHDLAVPAPEYLLKELDSKIDDDTVDKEGLDSLIGCLNSLYTNKKAYIDDIGHLRFRLEGKADIPMEKLSAGEKQVFIMFYTIIFSARPGSMVIIDEPEISLHVAWQQKLGRMFLDLCASRDMQILVATHSPMIIHDRWDLSRELRYERA